MICFICLFINFLLISLENNRLQEEIAYLQGRISELDRQLVNTNEELSDLQHDVYQTRSFNEMLSQKNNDLRLEIDCLRPAHESEEESCSTKRQRTKTKGKRHVHSSDDNNEPEEEEEDNDDDDDDDDDDVRVRLKSL